MPKLATLLCLLATLAPGLDALGIGAAPRALAAALPAVLASEPTRPLDGSELAELRLAFGEAQALTLPERVLEPVEILVRLDGADRVLRLRAHSLRAPGFRLLVAGAGGKRSELTPPPVTTVRGEILGLPGSRVAGRLEGGRLSASVRLAPAGEVWTVQPLREEVVEPDGPGSRRGRGRGTSPDPAPTGEDVPPPPIEHAIYPASAVVGGGEICGTVTPTGLPGTASFALPPTAAGSVTTICEIAIEADVPFYQANGSSVPATEADIEAILNGCEAIYLADAGIGYSITSILVRTAADPYTTTDAGTLLNQFRSEWLDTQAGVVRDVAHLFTGRNLDGSVIGVAFLAVICNPSAGFGLSQSRFTANLAGRVALTAHEVGHNWSADHCDGDPDCAIMCSGLGGCTGVVTAFGSASIAAIEAHKAQVNCLEEAVPPGGPAVSAVAPDYGPSIGGPPVVVGGADFVDDPSTSVQFGGVLGEIVAIDADAIVVVPPSGLAGERVDVLVSGPSGATLLEQGFGYEWTIAAGDKAASSLTAPDDVDRAYFDAPAGALLTATLRRVGLGAALVPGLRLLGPGDDELVLIEDDPAAPTGKARLLAFEVPESGTYRLELFGVGGSEGAYRLITKLKPVRKLQQVLALGPSSPTVAVSVDALAGTRVARLLVKAKPPQGDFATIEELPAALLPALVSITGPSGELDLADLLVASADGSKLVLTGLVLDELGTYTITIGGAGGSVGYAGLLLRLVPPKSAVQHEAEPSLE